MDYPWDPITFGHIAAVMHKYLRRVRSEEDDKQGKYHKLSDALHILGKKYAPELEEYLTKRMSDDPLVTEIDFDEFDSLHNVTELLSFVDEQDQNKILEYESEQRRTRTYLKDIDNEILYKTVIPLESKIEKI
jgi:hypothetical protein